MIDDPTPEVEKKSRARLQEDMDSHVQEEFRGRCVCRIGPNAAEIITDFARREKYDLILMGARGDSAEQYIKLGSLTNKVIQRSAVPVMTVPDTPETGTITNIMMPTDYSDESLQALKPAVYIAFKTGAKLTLFHVLELYGSLSEAHGIPAGSDVMESAKERLLNKIRGFLTASDYDIRLNIGSGNNHSFDFTENDTVHSIPAALEIDRGFSAHYQIVSYANNNADLLVVSTHGRSGLSHLMLGSTVEKLIQWAEIPVLTNRIRF